MSENTAESIIKEVKNLSKAEFRDLPGGGGQKVAVIPEGKAIESLKKYLDEYLPAPERIKTIATHTTAESFIDYMNRFRRSESAVFVRTDDSKNPSLLGMVDYHDSDAQISGGIDHPSFCEHKAIYTFPLSRQMKAWSGQSGKMMEQEDFAMWLRDRQHDVENPPLDWMQIPAPELQIIFDLLNVHDDRGGDIDDGAQDPDYDPSLAADDRYIPRSALYKLRKMRFGTVKTLLDMSRGIEVSVNSKADAKFDHKTGASTITYSEEHEQSAAGRKIRVPEFFFDYIPVFDGGTKQLLPVRLFYRVVNYRVRWLVELIDYQRLIRSAVDIVAAEVKQKTSLPIFYGIPNGGM